MYLKLLPKERTISMRLSKTPINPFSYVKQMKEDSSIMKWFSKPADVIQKEIGKKIMKKDECVSKDTYNQLKTDTLDFLNKIEEQVQNALFCLKGKSPVLKRSKTSRKEQELR